MPAPLVDFQRDTAFALFVLVVVTEAFLLLLDKLRSLLIPLIWAFFFAIPILAFADRVEELAVVIFDRVTVLICRSRSRRAPLKFRHVRGQNRIYLESTPDTHALLQRVRVRLLRRCLPCASGLCARLDQCFLSRLWGQRVRITSLAPEGGGTDPDAVGELLQGRSYYAFPSAPGELLAGDAESTSVELKLYLDRQKLYPGVLELPREEVEGTPEVEGTLEVDKRSTLSWCFAMIVAFGVVGLIAYAFVLLIGQSINGITDKDNFEAYKKGVQELIEDVNKGLNHIFPKDILENIKNNFLSELTQFGKDVAGDIVTFLEDIFGELFLFLLYLAFWIAEPLPISQPATKVFKDYMILKTLVCLLFAGIMAGLLWLLQCPIWPLYFFLTFLLNYIPEVGPILAGLLMIPGVLLDANLDKNTRYANVTLLVIFGTLAKILTGNIIEVKLYSKFGGEFMHIHPVTLFVFFTFCGYQLGATGMFISVPILGAIKYTLLSGAVPQRYLNTLLIIIEGDAWAAHRNVLSRDARGAGTSRNQPVSESVVSEMRAISTSA